VTVVGDVPGAAVERMARSVRPVATAAARARAKVDAGAPAQD
jgi:hypothetical protein